jgi:DNA-binding XRE family transcriptional regulator
MLPFPIPAPLVEKRPPTPSEVRERREYAKQTQPQMADALYVTERAVRHWEKGRSEMPLGLYHLYCLLTIPYRDPFDH